MIHAIILSVIGAFAVVIGTLFLGCIFFSWLMGQARKMFPEVDAETLDDVPDRITSVEEGR